MLYPCPRPANTAGEASPPLPLLPRGPISFLQLPAQPARGPALPRRAGQETMGRRKKSSAKKIVLKKRPSIPKEFKCPFCNHDNAVVCKLDWKRHIGSLDCKMCGVNYQTQINYLTEAVDVYCEWIDECEAVNDQQDDEYLPPRDAPARRQAAPERYTPATVEGDFEDDDDDDDEGIGLASRGAAGKAGQGIEADDDDEGLLDDDDDED